MTTPSMWPNNVWFGLDAWHSAQETPEVTDVKGLRVRSTSQCSSGTSGVCSRDTPLSPGSASGGLPRSLLSPVSDLDGKEPDAPSEANCSGRICEPGSLFSAGSGVNFNLLCDEMEELDLKCEPTFDKLNILINSLAASSSRLVTIDRVAWLDSLKVIRHRHQMLMEKDVALCVFCRNNNEPRSMYLSHKVRDRDGRVTCPVLRRYECPLCHRSGNEAHTLKYCPLATSVPSPSCFRTARNAVGRRRVL